jgi:hypothetical protein
MEQYPWRRVIKPSGIDIVAPDGTVRGHLQAYYAHTGDLNFVEDVSTDIQPGDEVRRLLPNGKEETYVVDNPQYMNVGHLGMAEHYKLSISRRHMYDRGTGGNYNINVSGTNSRVNIKSRDASSNLSVHGTVYDGIRQALTQTISDPAKLAELRLLVEQVETANDESSF